MASTGTNTTGMKSKNKDYMRIDEGKGDSYCHNSHLYPAYDIYDLDAIQINPVIFDVNINNYCQKMLVLCVYFAQLILMLRNKIRPLVV